MFGLVKGAKIHFHPNLIKYQREKSQSLQFINIQLRSQQIGTKNVCSAANRLMGMSGFCPASGETLN